MAEIGPVADFFLSEGHGGGLLDVADDAFDFEGVEGSLRGEGIEDLDDFSSLGEEVGEGDLGLLGVFYLGLEVEEAVWCGFIVAEFFGAFF